MAKVTQKPKPKQMTSHEVLLKAKEEGWIDSKGIIQLGPLQGAAFIGLIQFGKSNSWDWPSFLENIYPMWDLQPGKDVLEPTFHDETATMYPGADEKLVDLLMALMPNVEPDTLMEALEFDT